MTPRHNCQFLFSALLLTALFGCDFIDFIPSSKAPPEDLTPTSSPAASASPSPSASPNASASPSPSPTASLSLSDSPSYDYGGKAVGSTTDKTFTLTNSGSVAATSLESSFAGSVFLFVGSNYPGGGTCSTSLAASASCTVIVRFAPVGLGSQSETLSISYHNGNSTTSVTRTISGTGQTVASLSISDPTTFNFNDVTVGASSEKTFTVTNSGESTATSLAGSAFSGGHYTFLGGSYPGTGGSCSTTLSGASSTCTVVVKFAPLSNGTKTDTVTLSYFTGAAPTTATRPVTGTGKNPASLSFSGMGTHDFLSLVVGSSIDATFTITNGGETTATLMTYTLTTGIHYSLPAGSNCAGSLNAGATCDLVVRFAPGSAGVKDDRVTISYNNGANSTTSTKDVTGTGTSSSLIGSGTLDTSFHTDGALLRTLIATDASYTIAPQVDGKLIIGGVSHTPTTTTGFVGRFLTDGSLDSSFNTIGIAQAGDMEEQIYDVVIHSDGTILAAGASSNSGLPHETIYRYKTNGHLDTSFKTDGSTYITNITPHSLGVSLNLQTDGKIVVQTPITNTNQIRVSRILSDGNLDTSYSSIGEITWIGHANLLNLAQIRVDLTGKTISAATTQSSTNFWSIARFLSDGLLDTSFMTAGKLLFQHNLIDSTVRSIELDLLGRIHIFGAVGSNPSHGRFLSNGTIDTSFSTDGMVIDTSFNGEVKDGRLTGTNIATISTSSTSGFAISRFSTTGVFDTSFATNGVFTHGLFGGGSHTGTEITVRSNDNDLCATGYKVNDERGIEITCVRP